ncbi:MAG: hypothetical protein H0U87_05200, partial [Acidobacteria bacterium]|nr:hypothetical protein [Acidobacteriota bacterium]
RNDGEISPDRRAKILEEVGDVLWCITRIVIEFDASLADVAQANIENWKSVGGRTLSSTND